MAGQIYIGTSGWNYDHWQGRLYPEDLPQDQWFDHYAQHFATVEINNTFYQQPTNATLDQWRKQAPTGFLYAVKANRYITHIKRLKEPKKPLKRLFTNFRRLKKHLGPILYQLPPHWNVNLERLKHFVEELPSKLSHVMEFRNRDWLCEQTYELLPEHSVGLCVNYMLRRHPRRLTGPITYVRFHGSGKKYGGKYRKRRLEAWVDWIAEIVDDCDVFVYFNNDDDAHAVDDAQRLKEMIDQRGL